MITKLEAELVDALSDDFYGVWEFDWKLNSMGFTNDYVIRTKALSDLISKDYVNVFYGRLGDRSVEPVSKTEALLALVDRENWQPRTDIAAPVFFLATTDKADKAMGR